MSESTTAVIEQTARASYGKLLAFLSVRSRDIQACEDALSEAFRAAIERWPVDGIPASPEAWLMTVARNQLTDRGRATTRAHHHQSTLNLLSEELTQSSQAAADFPDERLKLLFVCGHPAIDESVRTPLMLQTVLGVESQEIASSFLVSPSAMMKKLSRAKQKIKQAGIAFEIPGPEELPERLEFVLEAIYAVYGRSWDHVGLTEVGRWDDLNEEAVYLSGLLVDFLPDNPEAKGLLALLLHCEARRKARFTADGRYVPLDEQDTSLWNLHSFRKAEALLRIAFTSGQIGRFQLEAAIQSAHGLRRLQNIDTARDVVVLYDALVGLIPAVGARVGLAGAVAELSGPEAGLMALDEIPSEAIQSYQPYWALRAHLLQSLGQREASHEAFERSLGLTEHPGVRAYLLEKMKA